VPPCRPSFNNSQRQKGISSLLPSDRRAAFSQPANKAWLLLITLMARPMPLPLLVALAASLLLLLSLPSVEGSSNHLSGSQMYASALTLQVRMQYTQQTYTTRHEERGVAL
jgi:hypothetical protein